MVLYPWKTTTPKRLLHVKLIEPPYTERYVRWCERSEGEIIAFLLLDWQVKITVDSGKDGKEMTQPGQKRNYQKELDRLIEGLQREGRIPKLLLHSCCACLLYTSDAADEL